MLEESPDEQPRERFVIGDEHSRPHVSGRLAVDVIVEDAVDYLGAK